MSDKLIKKLTTDVIRIFLWVLLLLGGQYAFFASLITWAFILMMFFMAIIYIADSEGASEHFDDDDVRKFKTWKHRSISIFYMGIMTVMLLHANYPFTAFANMCGFGSMFLMYSSMHKLKGLDQ